MQVAKRSDLAVRRIAVYLPCRGRVAFGLPLAKYIVMLRTAIDALAAMLFPARCRISGTALLNAGRNPRGDSCSASFEPIEQRMGRLPMPGAQVEIAWLRMQRRRRRHKGCAGCAGRLRCIRSGAPLRCVERRAAPCDLTARIRRSDAAGRLVRRTSGGDCGA